MKYSIVAVFHLHITVINCWLLHGRSAAFLGMTDIKQNSPKEFKVKLDYSLRTREKKNNGISDQQMTM